MRVAFWIGLAVVLVIALALAMKSGERAGAPAGSEVRGSDEASIPVIEDHLDNPDSASVLLSEPITETGDAEQGEGEDPPRWEFGTIPEHKSFVSTEVIDPATLPHEPKIGLKEPDATAKRTETAAAATIHPMFTPSEQTGVADNDGPLGGQLPRPDPNVPGPDGRVVSPGAATSTDRTTVVSRRAPVDPHGPGQPADPTEAAAAPPNYVLPGPDVEIEDPDASTSP